MARAIASPRLETPSLDRMLLTCALTVERLTHNRSAISKLVNPLTSKAKTSRSRRVRSRPGIDSGAAGWTNAWSASGAKVERPACAARIAAARARTSADEKIADLEHQLEQKRLALKKATVDLEASLSSARAEHDQELKKMQLAMQREEMRLLKENPELLLLTPQAARLAEASQTLKNARTVVSLSPADAQQTPEILGWFQSLLQNAVDSYRKKRER